MKAMILAAGLGTRLRPLTDDRPKALVEIGGRTLLEITLKRLRDFGVRDVIINVHYFADMIVEYLQAHDHFGMRIEISREEALLDTGGGLKQAAPFFGDSADRDEPFLVHNVDVISTIDLERMMHFHRENNALATLAVQDRETSRYLLFDPQLRLCGRRVRGQAEDEVVPPSQKLQALAFTGIHVISPRIFDAITEDGVFSIIDAYLRLAALGENILAFRADGAYWRDLGRVQDLQKAAQDFADGILPA